MNIFYTVLLCLAFTAIELLIGGTRLLFALPAYGLLAIAGLGSLRDLRRPKLPANGLCLASAFLFFGYVLARTLTSPVAYLAWADRFMVLGALVVYLLTACYLIDPRRRIWVLAALMILAGVNLVVGARQFASGDGFMLFGFIRSSAYLGRASGLYICPDHMSGFLEMSTCLGLGMAFWSRLRGWIKLLFGYGALCCLGGILISGSRGGYLSIAAGLGIFTLLSLLRVRATASALLPKAFLVVVILAAVIGGGAFVAFKGSHLLQARARVLVDRRDVRLLLWPAAMEEFELAPAFGTGASTYLYYGRQFRNPLVQADPVRTHNDYLELLAEYGAVGAGGLLLFLAAHFRWGWRAFAYLSMRFDGQGSGGGSNAAGWNIGALSAATCMLAHSVVDFNLHIPANALLMAFVFGLMANPGRSIDSSEQVARLWKLDYLPRLALPLTALWIIVQALPRFPGEYYAELARVALRDGHDVAAENLARQGLDHEQNNPMLYFYQGEARLALAGNGADTPFARSFRSGALESYRNGMRLAPEDVSMLMRVGESLTRLDELDEAGRVFEQGKVLDPNSAVFQTFYGFYLQRCGRLAEADAAYKRALELSSNPAAIEGRRQIAALPDTLPTP